VSSKAHAKTSVIGKPITMISTTQIEALTAALQKLSAQVE